jgi:hypothetical protein
MLSNSFKPSFKIALAILLGRLPGQIDAMLGGPKRR